MTDVHTKEQRSRNMSAVKARGNKTTELVFLELLKTNKITGWRRHYKKIYGTPDFAFPKQKVAVFIDGCFWHGCKCSHLPKTNRAFWKKKIRANKERDKKTNREVQKTGWTVLRVWEHELKNRPDRSIKKLALKLKS